MALARILIVILALLVAGSAATAPPVSAQQLSAVLAAMLRSGAGQNGGSGAAAATASAAHGSAIGGSSATTPGEGIIACHSASNGAKHGAVSRQRRLCCSLRVYWLGVSFSRVLLRPCAGASDAVTGGAAAEELSEDELLARAMQESMDEHQDRS